ncbi:hypothetical protein WL30_00840 [Burkholderia ubonensis]|nr:hypothetical protein WJ73_15995 [Burkholderia ubonensis]KWA76483.1 hypothetical protein WL30_00840 [Burkholderia ubonensis]
MFSVPLPLLGPNVMAPVTLTVAPSAMFSVPGADVPVRPLVEPVPSAMLVADQDDPWPVTVAAADPVTDAPASQ